MAPELTLRRDIIDALDKLRLAREVNPNHDPPPATRPHTGCDVCIGQRRFDYLMDVLTRNRKATL